ncbi:hypothetical protein CEXT_457811 [Caerostris extrusa]|uniref:Uncharacterized protein n=1 Tax=Caerostris extrusa TaxID=172846 RepID=A0AAV4P0F0_CAEEX|nr:hypothetical protein CEXT_457811 [Caerostris extrusa]
MNPDDAFKELKHIVEKCLPKRKKPFFPAVFSSSRNASISVPERKCVVPHISRVERQFLRLPTFQLWTDPLFMSFSVLEGGVCRITPPDKHLLRVIFRDGTMEARDKECHEIRGGF